MTGNTNFSALIIGQGIAGSMLARHYERHQLPFRIIDPLTTSTASRVAGGLLNPYTGRRLAKSHDWDRCFQAAKQTYQQLQAELGIQIWYDLQIVRAVHQTRDLNDLHARITSEDNQMRWLPPGDAVHESFVGEHFFSIEPAARIDMPLVTNTLREHWLRHEQLIADQFHDEDLELHSDGWHWKGQRFTSVIDCRGYQSSSTWFNLANLAPTRGDALKFQAPRLPQHRAYIKGTSITPIGESQFQAGANYVHDYQTPGPDTQYLSKLKDRLTAMFKPEVELSWRSSEAAIRPTTVNRRPIIGNGNKPGLWVLTGLGSKGGLTAPLAAQLLFEAIQGRQFKTIDL